MPSEFMSVTRASTVPAGGRSPGTEWFCIWEAESTQSKTNQKGNIGSLAALPISEPKSSQ